MNSVGHQSWYALLAAVSVRDRCSRVLYGSTNRISSIVDIQGDDRAIRPGLYVVSQKAVRSELVKRSYQQWELQTSSWEMISRTERSDEPERMRNPVCNSL